MKDGEFEWNLYHDKDNKSYEQDRLDKLQSLRIVELEADVERLTMDCFLANDHMHCSDMDRSEAKTYHQAKVGELEEEIRILKEENERLKNER